MEYSLNITSIFFQKVNSLLSKFLTGAGQSRKVFHRNRKIGSQRVRPGTSLSISRLHCLLVTQLIVEPQLFCSKKLSYSPVRSCMWLQLALLCLLSQKHSLRKFLHCKIF